MGDLRVAIADDEPVARARLARLLEEAGCRVAASFEEGAALLAWLGTRPELEALFLDIQMPGPSGLEVAAELPAPIPVVFVTAHRAHAVEAFDLSAVDYVLKPVSTERLAKALEKLRAKGIPALSGLQIRNLLHPQGRFPVRAGEGVVFLDLRKVSHFELEEDAVWAWAEGHRHRTRWETLREVQEAFPGAALLRIQRNLLLRPESVLGFKPAWGGRSTLRVQGGLDLPVSRSMTPQVKALLGA